MYQFIEVSDNLVTFEAYNNSIREILYLFQIGKISERYIKFNRMNCNLIVQLFNPHKYKFEPRRKYHLNLHNCTDCDINNVQTGIIHNTFEELDYVSKQHRPYIGDITYATIRIFFGDIPIKPLQSEDLEYNDNIIDQSMLDFINELEINHTERTEATDVTEDHISEVDEPRDEIDHGEGDEEVYYQDEILHN